MRPDSAKGVPVSASLEGLAKLSPREGQVLALASTGLLDKQIAAELGVTLNTLRTYWARIRSKAGNVPRSALAVAYVGSRTGPAASMVRVEGADWHIDVDRQVMVYYGDRGGIPAGEFAVDELVNLFHPEDAPRIRALLHSVEERDVPAFVFIARLVANDHIELVSSYVEVLRDENGRVERIVGRHVPVVDLTYSTAGDVVVGTYDRNLETGEDTADENFCSIFRVRRDDPNLFETAISRLCPDYQDVARNSIDEMMRQGRDTFWRTYRLCYDEGTRLWITSHMRLEPPGGSPTRLMITLMVYD